MRNNAWRFAVLALAIVAVACGEDTSADGPISSSLKETDSGSAVDGTALDSNVATDAGTQPQDTAQPPQDTAQPPQDTAQPPEDTAQPPVDVVTPPEDTTVVPEDTAQPPVDAGSTQPDTTTPPEDSGPTEIDAGTPPEDTGPADAGCPDDKACDDGNPCTTDVCNNAGACENTNNTTACDDGNACTEKDACKDGSCASGPAKVCDDGEACTTDACDEKTGCTAKIAEGAPCSDDAKCLKGTCKADAAGKPMCAVGDKAGCDDNNKCTTDSCDKAKGCVYTPVKDDTVCIDGDKCVTAAKCTGGKCGASTKTDCGDDNPCTDDVCDPKNGCSWAANTAKCDDGNKCTGNDACKNGQCIAGDAVDPEKACGDNNPCTVAACDKSKGCSNQPKVVKVNCDGTVAGGSCYKAFQQNGNWTAAEAACVKWGGHLVSIASAQENTQARQIANGACNNNGSFFIGATDAQKEGTWTWTDGTPWKYTNWGNNQPDNWNNNEDAAQMYGSGQWNDIGLTSGGNCYVCEKPATTAAPCDDGNVCTKGESCQAGKCSGGSTDACDDGKPCTKDNCDPKSGGCSWSALEGPCDDGNLCTGAGSCKAGKCAAGSAKNCDDKNTCTKDSCDAKTGKCVHDAAGAVGTKCDDGSKCTSETKCAADGKCAGKTVVCDDGNTCTLDKCNPDTGKCGFSANNGATCDVGPCTTGDSCKNGKCLPGTGKGCDDGNTCTLDSCDNKTGKCSYKNGNENGKCEDGKACTTGDVCKSGKCTPTKDDCGIASTNFGCTNQSSNNGWNLQQGGGGGARWRFDNTPAVAGMNCTLNYNDTNDYNPNPNSGTATNPGNHRRARSPYYDATKIKGAVEVSFDFYRDMDMSNTDRVMFWFYRNGDNNWNQLRDAIELPRTGCDGPGTSCMKKVFKGYKIYPKNVAGHSFRLYISVIGAGAGKGFYIDNVKVAQGPQTPEICGDSKDNDGDGAIDCKDTDCHGSALCVEQCDDGKDNDGDDKVDCDDSDCSGKVACLKPFWSKEFHCNQAHGWTLVNRNGWNTKWNVDQTPAVDALKSYGCTMNLNNGKNYCQNQQQWGNQIRCSALNAPYNGGNWYLSAMSPWIDGSKIATNVVLNFDAYLDIDTADSARVRVYVEGNNNYVHQFFIPESGCGSGTCIKKLQKNVSFTLTNVKQKKFRLRFLHVGQAQGQTEFYNQGAGFFFDNVRLYKP